MSAGASHLSRRSFIAMTAAATIARPALAAAAQPLTISVVFGNSIHWVIFAAVEKGMFKDEGFEPNVQPLQSSAHSVQMALSGDFQLATSQPETFVAAVEQGATDLAAMTAPMNRSDWVLVGARNITSVAQLKGTAIGLSGLRNSEGWLTDRLLASQGLKKGDYRLTIAGTSPAKVAALEKGGIGAAVLFQPSAEFAIKQGLPVLARFDTMRAYPTIFYIVKKSWAGTDQSGMRASRALQKSYAWLWDPANRAEAIQILAKYTKREPALLETVYDDYFVKTKLYSRDGKVDLAGFTSVLTDMAEDGAVFKVAPSPAKFMLAPDLGGLSA